mmetsp:Transcript_25096/g.54749  ORF Transcript_25096/g.54749 Transcript_25096/m.54749 type:complete len:218 (-) Transcript_25096:48-701(-)
MVPFAWACIEAGEGIDCVCNVPPTEGNDPLGHPEEHLILPHALVIEKRALIELGMVTLFHRRLELTQRAEETLEAAHSFGNIRLTSNICFTIMSGSCSAVSASRWGRSGRSVPSPAPLGRIQTSGSYRVGVNPRERRESEKCACQRSADVLRPYKALSMIRMQPSRSRNSGPARQYIFSLVLALTNALDTSPQRVSRLLLSAMTSRIRTLVPLTTDA